MVIFFMILGYEVHNINGENVLILYLNYDSEFGMDLRSQHKNSNMKQEIIKFMKAKKIKFNGDKVALSFGGIILAVLLLIETPNDVNSDFDLTYVSSHIVPNGIVEELEPNVEEEIKNTVLVKENLKVEDILKKEIKNNKVDKTTLNEETITTGQLITIYRSNGNVITLLMDEYLIGVVGAEMPASFNIEALKAQAVVARTYALKRIKNGGKLTDSVATQSYKDNDELKQLWGSSYDIYYQKIKNAVLATKDLAIYYNGELIDAVYHSTSNGQTEDSIYVWKNNIPYLKSVDSSWDKNATSYLRETNQDFNSVLTLLGIDIKEDVTFEILSRDDSGRVLEIKVGDKVFSGVEFRTSLGLRSTDFDLSLTNKILNITTRGYGHGVGMSQYGANGMAKQGYTYQQILKHYYTGINIY